MFFETSSITGTLKLLDLNKTFGNYFIVIFLARALWVFLLDVIRENESLMKQTRTFFIKKRKNWKAGNIKIWKPTILYDYSNPEKGLYILLIWR